MTGWYLTLNKVTEYTLEKETLMNGWKRISARTIQQHSAMLRK